LTSVVLSEIIDEYKPSAGILSSVSTINQTCLLLLNKRVERFVMLSDKTPVPLEIAYKTPETLGLDRVAAAVGAWTLQPGKPLLIIDMGTAITVDFVRADGVYLGGNISPGLQLRFKIVHQSTHRLPLVEADYPYELFGNDTVSAIRAGVMLGIQYEIEGYLRTYKKQYPELFAFLTGGDLKYFAEPLKSGIFVSKNLVLFGLNRILNNHV
jgi:type III pantothenate kinase